MYRGGENIKSKDSLIVVIPCYEPPKEFIDYAREVANGCKRLVVINDGSKKEFDPVFDEIAKIENVTYLTYEENHGKGYALKMAFKYCVENFDKGDIIVTADCDGQHRTKDVYRVYKACLTHPCDLILGSRNFDLPNVPKKSKTGNVTTRRIFSALYGIKLYDTQTGLRGFSVETAEKFLQAKGNRFEYEMNMLIYSKKHGIRVLEIPIETVYAEDPKDHVSHYRPFRDSIRIMNATMSNLTFFLFSSIVSAIIDVGAFYILSTFVFNGQSAVDILISTIGARVISSIFNFIFNFKYVFQGASKLSIIKYYILWSIQLCASYGIAFVLGSIIGIVGIWLSLLKGVGDFLLGLISYQIQQHWVFKGRDPYKFYGFLGSLVRSLLRKFSKKYRCNVLPYDEGAVYVCRHLDLHGPLTTLKWLNFQVHPMVLGAFCDKRAAYRQYKDYTLSERQGKKKKKFSLKAYIYSRGVSATMRSLKAIPVYRGKDVNSINTFRLALEALEKKQSVIVYPDIDYRGSDESNTGIYNGFLYLGVAYKKRTGKDLKFVPVYVNDEDLTINECDYITINSFHEEKESVTEYIKKAINTYESKK